MYIRASRFSMALCFLAQALWSQEHHHAETTGAAPQLGTVSFPVSCAPAVQTKFKRGIALLHSFGYNAARVEFQDVESQDPQCAMAYWGDAMTTFHQLWDRPSQKDLEHGLSLVRKAQQIGGKTDRERGYINAAAVLYKDDPAETYQMRTTAYSQALWDLHHLFPQDDEASIFYALSLLASPDASKNDFAFRKKAVGILNQVFLRRPDHPGVAHYLIHACDNPEMAKEALPAARRYAQIAPASAHALHMPSHIFARLGMWQDDIGSNVVSKAAAEEQHVASDRLHAMDFLEYAYLQLGDFGHAKEIEEEAMRVRKQEFTSDMADYFFYVQVHFPSLYALETRNWRNASVLQIPQGAEPDFQAGIYWARAIGAGHLHDVKAAKQAVDNYDLTLEAVRKSSYAYVAEQMTNSRDEAHAWLAFAEGKTEEATRLLLAAANKQDETGKGEVEIPAREMLGDMLDESGRPQEALAQYAMCLKTDPNRFNSLAGAAHAAELAHEPDNARRYYEELLSGREEGTGSENAELVRAKDYLSSHR